MAEHGVAFRLFLNHDAHRENVVNLVEAAALRLHLLMNRVVVLRAARHGRVDAHLFQTVRNLGACLVQELFERGGAFADHAHHLGVNLRAHGGEGEVLQLPLNRVQAQAVRERRVNFQGLFCLLRGRSLRHKTPGAGVVQAVGKLDEQHADVLAHGQHELTDRLNGGVLAVGHLVQLGHAVDQVGDLFTELLGELLHRVVGVFHRVVQQAGGEHGAGRAHLRKNRGHRHRVGDVRVAALTLLALVVVVRHLVGALQHADILVGVVAAHRAHDRRNHGREVNRFTVRVGGLHGGAAAKDQAVRPASTGGHDAVRAAVLLRDGCIRLGQGNRAGGANRRLVLGFRSRMRCGVLVSRGSLSFGPIRRGLGGLRLGSLVRRGGLSVGVHGRFCTHSRLLRAHDNQPRARVPHR